MYDTAKVIIGILIFLVLFTSPFWFSKATGQAGYPPDLEIYTKNIPGKDRCVMPTEYMRSSHMELLNSWRNSVVRDGQRIHISPDGRKFNKSLTGTCLGCHPNKEEFCDRCHNYMAVGTPDCWDCHVVPEEVTDGSR
jgi:hypothetical protein